MKMLKLECRVWPPSEDSEMERSTGFPVVRFGCDDGHVGEDRSGREGEARSSMEPLRVERKAAEQLRN